MGHRIVQAVIENGRIQSLDEALPAGKLRVHLIYDIEEKNSEKGRVAKALADTSGIYRGINGDAEAQTLRSQWERDSQR